MALKLGVHTGQQDVAMDELRLLWKFVDANGFDCVSVWDHFYEAPPIDGRHPVFEAVAAMAVIAAETEHVRIGCHVFCMQYRNPALLANSMMTLDHVSHGRIEVAIGAGWYAPEHRAYGYPFRPVKERLDQLEESAQILHLMFSEEAPSFEGTYYSIEEARLEPRPVQQPIPLVVGGRGERRTRRIAARWADGWNCRAGGVNVPFINVKEFERLNGVLDMWCEREDRDPTELERSVNIHMRMGANEADAERIVARARGRMPAESALLGTPQQAIETLKKYEEAGASRVNIGIRPPVEWDALQAFVEEVIPAVT